MRKNHLNIFILILLLTSCSYSKTDLNSERHLDSTKTNTEITKQVDINYVSDTIKQIIDELHLCEYSEFLNDSDYYSCYDKNMCDIRNIKKDDFTYNNFIFQAPGGSAGGAIIIFCKQKNGKYKKVQEYQGCLVEILKTTSNDFYDLILWHRAHQPDGEYILYRWNGNEYIKNKKLTNYELETNGG